MEFFEATHISMSIAGGLLFLLSLALIGLIKRKANGPNAPGWLRSDTNALIIAVLLTAPLALSLGLMIAGIVVFLSGGSEGLIDMAVMVAVLLIGWRGMKMLASRTAHQPA